MITLGEKLSKWSREVLEPSKETWGFVESDCSDESVEQWHSHMDVWFVQGIMQPSDTTRDDIMIQYGNP